MNTFFDEVRAVRFDEVHFADATVADLDSVLVARKGVPATPTIVAIMAKHGYEISTEFYKFVNQLKISKSLSTKVTPSTVVTKSLLTGAIRVSTPEGVTVTSTQGEVTKFSGGCLPVASPRANQVQIVSLCWGLTKIDAGEVVPKYSVLEIGAYGWKSLQSVASISLALLLNKEFPTIGIESGKKVSVSDARYVDKLTEEFTRQPLLLYYAFITSVITKVLNLGIMHPDSKVELPPWFIQAKLKTVFSKIPESEVSKAYARGDHGVHATIQQVLQKKLLILTSPLPLKQLLPPNQFNSFSAYQSVVQGQAVRKGDNAFLLGSGTSGMPTAEESIQMLLLSFIKGLNKPINIVGVDSHIVLTLIKSLEKNPGVRFVLSEADFMAVPLAIRSTFCLKKKLPNVISLYVSLRTMSHALMGQLRDQAAIAKANITIDEHFSLLEDTTTEYTYVMMSAVLPTSSKLIAYDLRMAYDGFGIFTQPGAPAPIMMETNATDTFVPLIPRDAKQWNTFVYDSNRAANLIFLSPINWSKHGRSNLLQSVVNKEVTLSWSEESFSATYGSRQPLLEEDLLAVPDETSTAGRQAPADIITTILPAPAVKGGSGPKKVYQIKASGPTTAPSAPVAPSPPPQPMPAPLPPPSVTPSLDNILSPTQELTDVGDASFDLFS